MAVAHRGGVGGHCPGRNPGSRWRRLEVGRCVGMERCRCQACGQTLYETIRLDGALTPNTMPAAAYREDQRGRFLQCPNCAARIDLVVRSARGDVLGPASGVVFDQVRESPIAPPWRKAAATRTERSLLPGPSSPVRPPHVAPARDPRVLSLQWSTSPDPAQLEGRAAIPADTVSERLRYLQAWLDVCREQLQATHLDVFEAALKVAMTMLPVTWAESPAGPTARARAPRARSGQA